MELYKYSSSKEKMHIRLGLIFSGLAGAIQPFYAIVIGRVVQMFDPSLDEDYRRELMT